jgi:co-chaperonin GroES (HSP10)
MSESSGSRYEWFPIDPFEDVVWIAQDEETKTAGGILLTGGAQYMPAGRVVAVGPGRWFYTAMNASGHNSSAVFVPTRTKVGDYVIFGKYQSGGEPLEIEGKKYLLCREGDLSGRSATQEPVQVRKALV